MPNYHIVREVACQSLLHYNDIYMPKKTVKQHLSKTLKRLLGLFIAGLFILGLIFVFTRPMLAPGSETKNVKKESEILGSNTGDIFNDSSSGEINPEAGENVSADSYLVYEEGTGKVLASHNPESVIAIASITKLMTAYVTQKYGSLSDVWTIESSSAISIRPILGLIPGDRIIIKDLVDAMLIGSANDSAATLGAYIKSTTGKPIIELMNTEAKLIGMNSTHFENPIGFDSEQNYSTAKDLKHLLDIVRPMSLFSEIDRKQSYSFKSESENTYSVKATNTLLAIDPEIHAIKTGYTDEAKGAMITAIERGDIKFIIIILGSTDREGDTKLLKKNILSQYQ